jgi:hypothetical protein
MSRHRGTTEPDLLRNVAEAAAQHNLRLEIHRPRRQPPEAQADVRLRVHHPAGKLDLLALIRTRLTPANFGATVAQLARLGHKDERVLITDEVSPQLAERLRDHDVLFLDSAGNACIRGQGLYVWVTGRRNELQRERLRTQVRAFRASGLRLLFTLLSRPEMVAADYRTLAASTGVALGTVAWVLRDLVALGYVHRSGRTRRVLLRPAELLDAWAQAFAHELRPRLLLGRFAAPDIAWWTATDPRDFGALWGGEPAAARSTGFLKPGTLTLWADQLPSKLLLAQRLRKSADGQVEVLKRFWHFPDAAEECGLVPAVLAYADLLAIADSRTLEAANQLFAGQIDGSFRTYLTHAAG